MEPVIPSAEERARALAEELRRTQALLERLVDGSRDAVVACDMAGRVVLFNKAAERLTRHTAGEALLSLDAAGLYCGGTAESVLERLRAAGPVGRVEGLRAEVRSRLGETIPVTLSASLILDGERELAWVAFLVDQRESEKQSMLAELAGAAAHELNQPLTSVLGYADLLRRKVADDDPNFRSVEIIYREAERMAEIVKKIGNVTRYETTTYVGNVKIVDIDKASDP